jgi:hypothetical protein
MEPMGGCGFVCVDAGGGLGERADWLRMTDWLVLFRFAAPVMEVSIWP